MIRQYVSHSFKFLVRFLVFVVILFWFSIYTFKFLILVSVVVFNLGGTACQDFESDRSKYTSY